jgi:hypothetical protein
MILRDIATYPLLPFKSLLLAIAAFRSPHGSFAPIAAVRCRTRAFSLAGGAGRSNSCLPDSLKGLRGVRVKAKTSGAKNAPALTRKASFRVCGPLWHSRQALCHCCAYNETGLRGACSPVSPQGKLAISGR